MKNFVVMIVLVKFDFSIQFNVKEDGLVKLYVINQNGETINVILDGDMPSGSYTYQSNISNVSSGNYIAVLRGKNQNESSKIIKN